MPWNIRKNLLTTSLIVLVIFFLAGLIGFRVALVILKDKVVSALGEGSEIRELHAGISGVEVYNLRIKGAKDWPAADTLRADQVKIVPSLKSLFSGQFRIHSITIIKPYISVLRTRKGKVLVVPSLIRNNDSQKPGSSGSSKHSDVTIGHIVLKDGSADFYDASAGPKIVRISLVQVQADLQDIAVPSLNGHSAFDVSAAVKDPKDFGRINFEGWADLSSKDSSIKLKLASVDMVPFQPYLLKSGDVRVLKGKLDLDLKSEVCDKKLRAPGRITISDLELAPSKGFMGTFMGMPREAVLAFLKDSNNRITLDFVLEGDLNNPKFTFNEALSKHMAVSMAELLKLSIGGAAKTAGELGSKGVEAAGDVVKGVGDVFKGVFGGSAKK